mgnify:CR=1 FL=1
MKARTASRLTRISPLNKASRLKALSALLQASIAAGAFSAAVPAVAGTKHVSDYFPGILWSNPLGWGPVGEPRGGDVIFVDKGPGIAFAPLLGIDETFEALTINASTDTNPLLFVPLTSTVIPIPAVNDFPANVLLPAMHLRSNNVTLGETQAGALIQTGGFLTVNQDLRLGHANTGWGFYSITSPDFTLRATGDGKMEVVWTKGTFDGVKLEFDLGSAGTRSDMDLRPNYTLNWLPPAGQSAIVKVRLRYIFKGNDFGNWSDWKNWTLTGA